MIWGRGAIKAQRSLRQNKGTRHYVENNDRAAQIATAEQNVAAVYQ